MTFCQTHWDKMRAAVDERGLMHLVAPDGQTAAAQIAAELEAGGQTPASFDPLMSMHWAILNNVTSTLGQPALYLLVDGPEDPVEGYAGYEGRTWPRCPLCYINLAHEVSCRDPGCGLDRATGYDRWVTLAADDAKAKAAELYPDNPGGSDRG